MNIIGILVFIPLILTGHLPRRYGLSFYIEIGEDWGGLELGCFFLVCKDPGTYLLNHESGHGIQNIIFGPFFLFLWFAGIIRYWYRELHYYKKGLEPPTDYDDIWFEGQATRLGSKYYEE
jgi:hypothetical protein